MKREFLDFSLMSSAQTGIEYSKVRDWRLKVCKVISYFVSKVAEVDLQATARIEELRQIWEISRSFGGDSEYIGGERWQDGSEGIWKKERVRSEV